MASERELPPPEDQYVYRRIPCWFLDFKKPTANSEAKLANNVFKRRPTETTLSVYSYKDLNAREVLQKAIDDANKDKNSDIAETSEKGSYFLEENGEDVNQLIEKGWRVAVIEKAAFKEVNWEVSDPDETGHIDVLTLDESDLLDKLKQLNRKAILLNRAELEG
jgi:hypothetical protein